MSIKLPTTPKPPPLQAGDRLTREQFEERYAAMPHLKKAELIEGEVFIQPPISFGHHGRHTDDLAWFVREYTRATAGTDSGLQSTVRLDANNERQPDLVLLIEPECGGRVELDESEFIVGAPELVAEISYSSVSIDLGRNLNIYRRNRVGEYLVFRVQDRAIDWFVFQADQFDRLAPDADDILKSVVFPGLWLHCNAFWARDFSKLESVLKKGLASPEHAEFVRKLASAKNC